MTLRSGCWGTWITFPKTSGLYSGSDKKPKILLEVNRRLEVLRWLLRLAFDRRLLAGKQYAYSSEQITECGRMIGGWYKQALAKEEVIEASQGAI